MQASDVARERAHFYAAKRRSRILHALLKSRSCVAYGWRTVGDEVGARVFAMSLRNGFADGGGTLGVGVGVHLGEQ